MIVVGQENWADLYRSFASRYADPFEAQWEWEHLLAEEMRDLFMCVEGEEECGRGFLIEDEAKARWDMAVELAFYRPIRNLWLQEEMGRRLSQHQALGNKLWFKCYVERVHLFPHGRIPALHEPMTVRREMSQRRIHVMKHTEEFRSILRTMEAQEREQLLQHEAASRPCTKMGTEIAIHKVTDLSRDFCLTMTCLLCVGFYCYFSVLISRN
jgi:hypothetical protein